VFSDYYAEKNSKKRLAWMWGLGNASVRGAWGKKSYDLQAFTLTTSFSPFLFYSPKEGATERRRGGSV
jgi:hypothetical protein